MRRRLQPRLSLLITITTTIVVAGLIVSFVAIPTIRRIIDAQKNITNIQRSLEAHLEKTKEVRRSLQRLGEAALAANELSGAAIEPGQELDLITTFERLAAEHEITQTIRLSYTDAPKSGDAPDPKQLLPPYYTFTFLNQGRFDDHVRYLYALENLTPYIIIERLQWEKKSGIGDTQNFVTLSFDGHVAVHGSKPLSPSP